MVVKILGTKYTIVKVKASEDKYLMSESANGYCDNTSHKIVVADLTGEYELDEIEEYEKKILRHEIVHAFLFESGLQENFEHRRIGHEETMVDWIASQFPKMMKAFKKAGCL